LSRLFYYLKKLLRTKKQLIFKSKFTLLRYKKFLRRIDLLMKNIIKALIWKLIKFLLKQIISVLPLPEFALNIILTIICKNIC